MLKKCWFLAFLSLYIVDFAAAQDINWKTTKNWKLYDIHKQAATRYTLDTLKYFKNIRLNADSMQSFLNSVTAWPLEKYSMWMGLLIATCETEDKKTKKVIISVYGGFFYVPENHRYYQVSSDLTETWLEFLNNASSRITDNH